MDESALRTLLSSLDASRSAWHGRLHVFTFLVIVGLGFDLFVIIKEFRNDWKDFRYGQIHPYEIHLPKQPSVWLLVLGLVGTALIVIGVWGELYVDVKVGEVETNIRAANDALLGLIIQEAGDAATSAKTAREESTAAKTEADAAKLSAGQALTLAHAAELSLAKAENDAGKAQTAAASALTTATGASTRAGKAEASLGKAEAEAQSAESSASNALILAREARQEAASFESDLARLKQQAADRVLDEYQQEQVKLRVEPFLGAPYELAVADTPEAENLVAEIDAVVDSAGWLYAASEDKGFRLTKKLPNGHEVSQITVKGVEIGLTPALLAKLKPAADALAKALNSEGIAAFVVKLPEDNPSPKHIHIMVGNKP